jgi:hypothetical protein
MLKNPLRHIISVNAILGWVCYVQDTQYAAMDWKEWTPSVSVKDTENDENDMQRGTTNHFSLLAPY